MLIVSRGEVADNCQKVKQHKLTFPIVLQRKWNISKHYPKFATPIGYLIDEAGVTATEITIGAEVILGLMAGAASAKAKEAIFISFWRSTHNSLWKGPTDGHAV